ncbi:tRNA1(Val) (adenine(37)-N6)-methyltransferase [Tetragenococcus koreensis]|uniref:Methyltransferase small domain-containing protein n=1 Tax=Tetragenococcus koreensis TaxID=290335 RepID=A0AAN4UCW5_9ENTE|nr:tRNA1(Val) (adenine(37)-N6)-methyltransferase [Tetragenococcus koreensis]AYW45627.1 SAM-dependent methyltransferase [Tetragenococcus koreensis]MCF1585759.1 tRNA1(Val) (adenine(37)-N6)-methyltransferase [Tetragenococcus koreensis]MCF1615262.1 tRNA1(Val) (adenine(37)-N6)-methyltransferase [Tetragenococcus koreensis]MCF1617594.1 tRNA1(Val) (adenine(37)-N6)-methyltransferase [Tetragenococcus koreensis]MCF1620153.1 tRNA1(Val) (adenine(37)-N6)-methyltransferase [Tetragenococcus koreensis]
MCLKEDERIDQLYAKDVKIIQSSNVFSFSLDAVLLANFPNIPKKGIVVDLCAGNGAVGLFVAKKTKSRIYQIEIQERLADMAQRSVQLNHLEDQIDVLPINLKDSLNKISSDSCDLVLCNPPYFKNLPTNHKNPNPYYATARHEIHTNLDEVLFISSKLLKMNGHFAMVHRPERFLEVIDLMKKNRLAPKRVQFVYPKAGKDANILLIEGIKDGKTDGFKVLPPMFTYDAAGNYSLETRRLLYGE